mmetsp:Transcript_33720/g.68831  ORF Transcript_33720/g.68831 Transcript_33720/m.68831 type:complete len:243 (+) Transcript_33720:106-834(+)
MKYQNFECTLTYFFGTVCLVGIQASDRAYTRQICGLVRHPTFKDARFSFSLTSPDIVLSTTYQYIWPSSSISCFFPCIFNLSAMDFKSVFVSSSALLAILPFSEFASSSNNSSLVSFTDSIAPLTSPLVMSFRLLATLAAASATGFPVIVSKTAFIPNTAAFVPLSATSLMDPTPPLDSPLTTRSLDMAAGNLGTSSPNSTAFLFLSRSNRESNALIRTLAVSARLAACSRAASISSISYHR